MKTVTFFLRLTARSLAAFRKQVWLLAAVLVCCLVLPPAVGPAAQSLLEDGISFSGLTLAVTAPEGDPTPGLLEKYLGNMRDVSRYCSMVAMDEAAAKHALETGEVTAVLVLPENFVQGVLNGSNPDVEVLVSGERPLESLLTLWVGQSAADLLSCVQAGVYAVQEAWESSPPDGLPWDQVKMEINLRYIAWTLNRQKLFEERELAATGLLPVVLHYGLALTAYLGLSLAPLFCCLHTRQRRVFQRRLRCAGRNSIWSYGSDLLASWLVQFVLLAGPVLLLVEGALWARLAAAAGAALFCALFGNLCCLLTGSAANCGLLAFGVSLVSLVVAGGILPPILLPEFVRQLQWLSPVTWLQRLLAMPMELTEGNHIMFWVMGLAALGMAVISAVLYDRRITEQEAA